MKRTHIRILVLAVGLISLLFLAVRWLPQQSGTVEPALSARASRNQPEPTASTNARSKRPQRSYPKPGADFTEHDARQLKDFYLRSCEGRDVDVDQALALLTEAYEEACFCSREKPLPIEFLVVDSPGEKISFSLRHQPFEASLRYLAALAGLSVRSEGNRFELFREDDGVSQKPDQVELSKACGQRLLAMLRDGRTDGDGGELQDMLPAAGLIRDSKTIIAAGNAGGLSINGSAGDLAAVRQWLQMDAISNTTLTVTAKFITSPEALEFPGNSLSDAEAQSLLRELSQNKGISLMTVPSVTLRDADKATLEFDTAWLGCKMEYQVERLGLKTLATDHTEMLPDKQHEASRTKDADYLTSSQRVQLVTVSQDPQSTICKLVTIEATDTPPPTADDQPGSGLPLVGGYPVAKALPDREGFVLSPYNNKIIDVGGIPSGTLVQDPTYPASEKKYFRAP